MYSESHCHLRGIGEETVKKAEEAGVRLILAAGIDILSSIEAVSTASKYGIVKGCVGIHPWRADELRHETLSELRILAAEPEVVAISEIGLDYKGRRTPQWEFTEEYIDPEIQRKAFKEQIRLAKELNLPVLVHDRTPGEGVLDILEEESIAGIGAAIHGFSKGYDYSRRSVDMGVYLSIGRRSIQEDNGELMDTIRDIPLEWLLTETDSGDPTGVLEVAEKIAELKGLSAEEVGRVTTDNLRKLIKA
ncbi:MAG: TatD family hydrolase [Candidatus Bathyarchaeota archaeon]|jgi:TatD DNase family protein